MIILFYLFDEADRWLFQEIHFLWHSAWLDATIPFFSHPFAHYKPILLGLAAVLIVWSGRRMRRTLIFVVLAVALSDVVSSQILKKLYGIARPLAEGGQYDLAYSFPSSHAANTWAAIGLFQREHPRFRQLLWAFGLLVCFSRIYVGDHYPGDVIAGLVLGLGIGWGVHRLLAPAENAMNWIKARYRLRIAPYLSGNK